MQTSVKTAIDKLDFSAVSELLQYVLKKLKDSEDGFSALLPQDINKEEEIAIFQNIAMSLISLYGKNKSDEEIIKEALAIYFKTHP